MSRLAEILGALAAKPTASANIGKALAAIDRYAKNVELVLAQTLAIRKPADEAGNQINANLQQAQALIGNLRRIAGAAIHSTGGAATAVSANVAAHAATAATAAPKSSRNVASSRLPSTVMGELCERESKDFNR